MLLKSTGAAPPFPAKQNSAPPEKGPQSSDPVAAHAHAAPQIVEAAQSQERKRRVKLEG